MEKKSEIKNNKKSNITNTNSQKETQSEKPTALPNKTFSNKNDNFSIKDNSPKKSGISFLKQSNNIIFDNNPDKKNNKNSDKNFNKCNKRKNSDNNDAENYLKSETNEKMNQMNFENFPDLNKGTFNNFNIEKSAHINDLNNLKIDLHNEMKHFNNLNRCTFDDNNSDLKTETYKINDLPIIKNKKKEKTEINYFKIYEQHEIFAKKHNFLFVLFIIGIVINMTSYCLSLYLLQYGNKDDFLCFGGVAILTVICYSLGIVAIKQDKQLIYSVIKNKKDPEKILQSRRRKNIILFLHVLLLSFNYQIIIVLENTVFINNIKMSIRGKGYNISSWKRSFQTKDYTEILSSFQKINIPFLIFSWLSVALTLFILIYNFYYLKSYRTIKSLIQIICVVLVQASLFQIYFGKYCQNYIKITSLDEVTYSWVTPGEIAIGILGFFLGIYGIYAFFVENKKLLIIFNCICVILFILSVIFTRGLRGLGNKFTSYKISSCNSLFKFISEDSLVYKNSDCVTKYLFTAESLEGIQCPKERIMINWELTESINNNGNVDNENYLKFGCIDQSCCLQTYFKIKVKYNYLEMISYYQIIDSIILFIFGIYIYINIGTENALEEELLDKIMHWIITGVCVLLIVVVSAIFSIQKSYSRQSEVNKIKNYEVNEFLTLIDRNLVIPTKKNKLIEATNEIFEKNKKGIINSYDYNVYLEDVDNNNFDLLYFDYYLFSEYVNILNKDDLSKNGNYFSYINTTFSNKTQMINFKSTKNIVNSLLNYFDYKLINPINPNNNLTVTINVIFKNNNLTKNLEEINNIKKFRTLSDTTNIIKITKENILSAYDKNTGLSEINLLKNIKINFSIVDKKYPFYIKGNILNDKGDSLINIYNYYFGPENLIYSIKSNNNGSFILGPLYPLSDTEIFELNIEIYKTKNNFNNEINYARDDYYYSYNEIIKIGCIDYFGKYFKYHRIKNVLLPKKISKNYKISGNVYETKNDENPKALSNVNIKLYEGGYNYLVSEIIENIKNGNNDNYYLSQTISDKEGDFNLNVNSNGYYFLIYEKSNYFIETQKIFINETSENNIKINKMELIKIFNAGKIMVKLEWESKPNDLDLICRFKVSEKDYCYTFFGNERCVETSFYTDAKNGEGKYSEIIEVEEFSDYMYLFYVRKYYDESNGEAKNERKINGVDMNRNLNFTDLYKNNNETLVNSNAKLLIYSNGLKYSTIRVDINDYINENLSIENSYNEEDNKGIYWIGFCINGKEGLNSIKIINKISKIEPAKNICSDYYE